ncbi:DUF441 domain-containing protein [Pragia fontium]|uniref:UPF0756 membrane protein SAMN02745723_10796 n=2 Tax=Pragia fontium TaxID=82985 RepID=A0AAJ4WBM0_9GAMM|nr:DUF441 domain-containing protein [Pragia fontium]AKJ42915.1 membrane protein [Pragia fontium]SFD05442.1 Uncharacterized membrane protein, DUF441 family [Pragia fontium DSM 5563 = ATCC 49100]SUB83327.1 Protein of uncharacterised function (DUF441) [Pragia fontium]VEJ56223.1 Protein of uncharacterised function (DUF441) [Pragia fontium]GKX63910.1 UPF0756 membrane protein [Pragia fontium]
MPSIDPTLIVLLVLAGLGILSHNNTVTIAILVLLILRLTPLEAAFPMVQKYGLTVGITILTVAVMSPLASGKMTPSVLMQVFVNWQSLVAIVIGIAVAWLGGRGVTLMTSQPTIVAGLLIGTIIGVAFFRGIPVGPLIAAGVVSLIIGKT